MELVSATIQCNHNCCLIYGTEAQEGQGIVRHRSGRETRTLAIALAQTLAENFHKNVIMKIKWFHFSS